MTTTFVALALGIAPCAVHSFCHADDAGWRQCLDCHMREWNLSDMRPPEPPIARAPEPVNHCATCKHWEPLPS